MTIDLKKILFPLTFNVTDLFKEMIDKWRDMISFCEGVSNVTIVCRDGTLQSHKILFARVSEFTKDLMMPIPSSDDITIMLPDFLTDHVLLVINQFNFGVSNKSILNSDLLCALKCPSFRTSMLAGEMLLDNQSNKKEEVSNVRTNENECDNEDIHEDSSVSNQESEEEKVNIRLSDDENKEFTDDEYKESCDINNDESYTTKFKSWSGIFESELNHLSFNESKVTSKFDEGKDKVASRVYEGEIQELANQLLNDDNDDFKGDKKVNIKRKEMYRNAVIAIANGKCSSVSNASIKYGVNQK